MRMPNLLDFALGLTAATAITLTGTAATAHADTYALTNVEVHHRCTLPPGQGISVPNPEIKATTTRSVKLLLVAFPPGKAPVPADDLGYQPYDNGTRVTRTVKPTIFKVGEGETIGLGLVGEPDANGVVTVHGERLVTAEKCQY